ncbi:MAG: hypothetical protein HY881_10265 [Deltaproteobacteria bacterium]|nr:hypothetical protein [Deltaproteobacteria bacterium]
MKILSGKSQALALFFVTLLICFSLNSQAFAIWNCAQGSSGQLNDPSQLNTAAEPRVYYDWGMGYNQKPNATNWVVFPVPSFGLTWVRFIALNLNGVAGGDIYVDQVAVWSGGTQLGANMPVNWTGSNLGWQLLDLGSQYQVSSLSVTLRTQTGALGGMLQVYSVCADFEF